MGRGPSTTSDGRVWPHASVIWLCPDCRTLQKNPDAVTRMRIRRLYATYKPHYLSSGVEQVVFAKGRAPEARTARAFRLMRQHLPGKGRVLDFGTGNGAALKSFLQRFPRWTGDAYDVSRHKQREVLKIPRVRAFFSAAEDLPENRYEAVILWHTLEHIFHPRAVLDAIRTLLRPGGLLLLQVPDLLRNPFDLGIYDHVSHFTRRSLLHLMAGWGWKLEIDGMDWFHNTLTFGFSPSGQSGRLPSEAKPKRPFQELGKLLSRFKKRNKHPIRFSGRLKGLFWSMPKVAVSPWPLWTRTQTAGASTSWVSLFYLPPTGQLGRFSSPFPGPKPGKSEDVFSPLRKKQIRKKLEQDEQGSPPSERGRHFLSHLGKKLRRTVFKGNP